MLEEWGMRVLSAAFFFFFFFLEPEASSRSKLQAKLVQFADKSNALARRIEAGAPYHREVALLRRSFLVVAQAQHGGKIGWARGECERPKYGSKL
jgi:hypothetical protein